MTTNELRDTQNYYLPRPDFELMPAAGCCPLNQSINSASMGSNPARKLVGVKTSILSLELFLPFFFSGRKFSWRWVHTYLNISHPSLSHTYSLSHSLMHTHTHTLTLFLSLKYTYCTLASHILSHEALDSPSHSHTRSHTNTNSQPHTCIHMHSLSHTLPVFHFIRYPERMLGAHSRSLISASVWSTTIP